MSIAKSDGSMTYWDMGEPLVYLQNSNQTYTLQFWDMGEPFILGEIAGSDKMMPFFWGV